MLSVELHCHSVLSYDGHDPVELLLEQAAAVGLDAIAVTDHDEIEASRETAQIAAEYGLIGIPGIEITSSVGHVLGLGVESVVPAGLPFGETVDRIHEQGGIVVIPHPFQASRHGVAPHLPTDALAKADAIEVYNSRLITGRSNRKAERFAGAHSIPMTAGSDAHIAEMVGQAVTHVATDDRSVGGILDAILNGETTVVGQRTPWRISLRQAAGAAKRRISYSASDLLSGVSRGLF